ncbi:type III secretion system ATPase SctN [Enterobacter sp. 22466]|uniref:type III secretion system ATPase SctN n=1 Tax=Enterobacter sp. 22466 TaxID=3453924 RepID=UPI003F8523B1
MPHSLSQCFKHIAHPLRIQGSMIEAELPGTSIGEVCEVQASLQDETIVGHAQVIGFRDNRTLLSLLSDSSGFSRQHVLVPTGGPFCLTLSDNLLGCVVDAMGRICGTLGQRPLPQHIHCEQRKIEGQILDFSQRSPISRPLNSGIRAIDALLTCGQGQRLGIFAAAGCGKTSLMNMLIEHSEADVYVIGLIGERGREVTEFVEELKNTSRCAQVVLVYATSDRSSVERCNAAQVASTVAEYFRDQGRNVLLFIDSITRYARALRDMALGMGELPARRGYPASVFENLPKLLERPGCTPQGSITAFYTVLVENEEEADVIGDEVRSILDGHIYLSQKLAAQGHYPAIDVLHSISRVFHQVTEPAHQQAAARFRELLVRQRDMQMYLDLGEYRRGENDDNDLAFDKKALMRDFLCQPLPQKTSIAQTMEQFYGCLA